MEKLKPFGNPTNNEDPQTASDLANGETGESEPTRPTSGEGVANAVDRWEEEGGAPALPWRRGIPGHDAQRPASRRFHTARVICLLTFSEGSFEHAASGKSYDAALLKVRIARFLHNHKDDWAAR